jgi:hypothetical protein
MQTFSVSKRLAEAKMLDRQQAPTPYTFSIPLLQMPQPAPNPSQQLYAVSRDVDFAEADRQRVMSRM